MPKPMLKPGWRDWRVSVICALLAALVWCVFGQTVRFGFVNYDDMFVYQTPEVTRGLAPGGIAWAFTHAPGGTWFPLTTITHMMDCQAYGLWAGGHHLTNVLLHAVAAVLLFLVLRQMTGAHWRGAFVAALFAIHPLRVESVAWVTERKDVLSGIFFMLTLWAYTRYARRPGSTASYAMVLVWFALGLMSKSMLVTAPFVLILLDYWPLGRLQNASQLRGLLKEKIPLFALSLLSCLASLLAAKEIIQPVAHISFLLRFRNALISYVIYFWKLIHPGQLAVFYPLLEHGREAWQAMGACLLLTGLTVGAWFLRRKQPYLLVGWLWYLGMLVPVIGIVQVGAQAYADRFTYLPQIGLCLAGTWAAADWAGVWRRRRLALGAIAIVALGLLSVDAWRQTAFWRNTITLWTHALACTQDNYIAHTNLGLALLEQGQTEEAIDEYRESLRINPVQLDAQYNLGLVLFQQGSTGEAISHYRAALQIDPGNANACESLANALAQEGLTGEAIAQYRAALQLRPDNAEAHYGLGKALAREGLIGEGIAEYRAALRINPEYADAHNNLGIALAHQGQFEEAIAHIQKAFELQPSSLAHENNLAWVLATAPQASLRNGPKALELAMNANFATGGSNPGIIQTLAAAYAAAGQFSNAVRTTQQALQMAPAQSSPALADELRRELKLYQAGRPFENAR